MDTNVVIELLGGVLPVSGKDWLQDIIDQNLHALSVINEIEFLGFESTNAEMKVMEAFTDASAILPLSDAIVQKTIELRKTYRIKLPDAIIAATALTHNLTLITRNTSDFRNIVGLVCLNAHNV